MTRFAACAASDRISVLLEGMTILYDRRSGVTHILAPPAPELLDALAEGPADGAGLVDRLGGADAIEAEDDPVAVVAARLGELAAAGLVARA